MVRLGLGHLEIIKISQRAIYISGRYTSQTKQIKVESIVGESANTGFRRALDLVASVKYGDMPAYIALGTSATPKNPENPYLANEVGRYPRSKTSLSVGASKDATAFIEAWWVRQHEYVITPTSDFTIEEWGVSESNVANSALVAGGIFPTPLPLLAGQTYIFRYKTTVYYTNDITTTSVYRAGLSPIYQFTNDMSLPHTPEFAEAAMAGMVTYVYDGFTYNLYAINGSGTLFTPTVEAYTTESYRRTYTATVSPHYWYISFAFQRDGVGNVPWRVYLASGDLNYYYSSRTVSLNLYWAPYDDF